MHRSRGGKGTVANGSIQGPSLAAALGFQYVQPTGASPAAQPLLISAHFRIHDLTTVGSVNYAILVQ